MPQILRRQILNEVLELRSSASENLKDVETAYLRFPIPDAEAKATIVVEIDGPALCGRLPVVGWETSQPLLADALRSWQVKTLANRLVLAAIRRDHDVLHGCAVETAVGAIALIGGSGTGKSTLALELGRFGYPLLCEGQIPIERVTGLVKPFPRGFEMFRETAGALAAGGFRSEEKVTVPAPLVPSRSASALHSIVFLQELFPGTSRQTIEVGCAPQEKVPVIEFLRDRGAYDMVDDTRDRRTLVRCRFDPWAGHDLDGLFRGIAERGLRPLFLSCAPVTPPDWGRPLVATRINSTMATLGVAANASLTTLRLPACESDSGILARFSCYADKAQAYLLVNGALSERTRWIMDRLPATGVTSC